MQGISPESVHRLVEQLLQRDTFHFHMNVRAVVDYRFLLYIRKQTWNPMVWFSSIRVLPPNLTADILSNSINSSFCLVMALVGLL